MNEPIEDEFGRCQPSDEQPLPAGSQGTKFLMRRSPLSREEVWLMAWCAAASRNGFTGAYSSKWADDALKDYDERFGEIRASKMLPIGSGIGIHHPASQ